MTQVKPNVNPTHRYSIKETAELLGVNRHTILRWMRRGLMRFGIRKVNMRKYVTGLEIMRCWNEGY